MSIFSFYSDPGLNHPENWVNSSSRLILNAGEALEFVISLNKSRLESEYLPDRFLTRISIGHESLKRMKWKLKLSLWLAFVRYKYNNVEDCCSSTEHILLKGFPVASIVSALPRLSANALNHYKLCNLSIPTFNLKAIWREARQNQLSNNQELAATSEMAFESQLS